MKLNTIAMRCWIVAVLAALGTVSHAATKQTVLEPSVAWTASSPLGLQLPSTIDTLFQDYHLRFVPSMVSDAWATTGNYGAPGQDQIFMNRKPISDFFLEDAMDAWMHTSERQRFYNTRIPMTLLAYSTGGNKYSNQDRTTAVFSGNVDKRLQVGGHIDYLYSKGSYDQQADKEFTWGLSGSYTGDRYSLMTALNHHNFTVKESGGITNDLYITDPAQVQGGETRVDNKSIPTNLTTAQSNLEGTQFFMNHRYKVGFYRYRRDSVTDTVISRTYIPVTSFIWNLDFKHSRHKFLTQSGSEDAGVFDHSYLSATGTDERTSYWHLTNTLGISLLEGFNRFARFGLSAYATHEIRRYTQVSDTLTGNVDVWPTSDSLTITAPARTTQNLLWVGGQLTKQQGSTLHYMANARFGVLGPVAGDIDIDGNIDVRLPLLGDTAQVTAFGYFRNEAAPYLLQHFISNHYAWSNDFGKQTRFRVGGEITFPFTWTRVNVGYETLKNYLYFGTDALPAQCSSPIHVLSLQAKQDLHFKAFNWENRLTFQTSSNEDVLPLPKFALYSNMYLRFLVAHVLHVQVGIDCNYYTSYYAPTYNPATMTFYNQTDTKCGNFLFANLYANFKLKKARFYVMYSHANHGLIGNNNYFAIPHYPLNPHRIQFGVSVDFAN